MENSDYKILLVDDEPDILEFLSYNIRKEGFQVETASNGIESIEIAKKFRPHLIILDVMMPEMDGIETCDKLREMPDFSDVLITFLTARSEDYSQIAGFDAGADDYISKPIKPKVLISRIKAMLKRSNRSNATAQNEENTIKQIGPIAIDKERYLVLKDNEELSLPRKEFELLCLLSSRPQRVFTREEIYNGVWGENIIVGDRTIDVHIRKLREKLGDNLIKTVKGVGYKFVDNE
ncbi:DNA-binding response regulator [Ancylomarina euxinus]|uniref:Phosphate regulon transcriptional regulatory protein PhoB n=1 Tax=Ancylomarina euxinus TaxID=2283627 RepID=A0A425Y7B5_9BACT|nr:response regulator transcription factor [Ancylomarina euxinus]MCZ4693690.1 response regulator transcription factor [Ancylomarina euxinus]MUP13917.1 response regulator [Ancylomarina euxinus]RRG24455.1 DNA-binding response regulator [Ancylomarina euxinus]